MEKTSNIVQQILMTLPLHRKALAFIFKHKIWQGFWTYGWVIRFLLIIGALAGLKFLDVFIDWITSINGINPVEAIYSMGMLVGNVASEGYNFLFAGSMKYLVIVLVEIIIFHICRRTLEILINKKSDMTFDTFLRAQIRMLKVVFRAWLLELIITNVIKVAFNIFDFFEPMQMLLIFGVQCYFLGFVIMDNYVEQFELTIKESFEFGKKYIGVSLAIGVVLYVFMLIPLVGSLIGPAIAAVTLTMVMLQISDLHILGRQTVDGVEEIV